MVVAREGGHLAVGSDDAWPSEPELVPSTLRLGEYVVKSTQKRAPCSARAPLPCCVTTRLCDNAGTCSSFTSVGARDSWRSEEARTPPSWSSSSLWRVVEPCAIARWIHSAGPTSPPPIAAAFRTASSPVAVNAPPPTRSSAATRSRRRPRTIDRGRCSLGHLVRRTNLARQPAPACSPAWMAVSAMV
jgi:hypothetical protein